MLNIDDAGNPQYRYRSLVLLLLDIVDSMLALCESDIATAIAAIANVTPNTYTTWADTG